MRAYARVTNQGMKAEIKDKGFVISYVLFGFVISYTVSVLGNFLYNFQGVFPF